MTLRIAIADASSADFLHVLDIWRDAFPGLGLSSSFARRDYLARVKSRIERGEIAVAVAHAGSETVGVLNLSMVRANLRDVDVSIGAISGVAVAASSRGSGVGSKLIDWALERATSDGAIAVCLHPFSPAYYARLGFGYGPLLYRFRFSLSSLPRRTGDATVKRLTPDDAPAVVAFHDRLRTRTHGMTSWHPDLVGRILAMEPVACVAVFERDTITGFMSAVTHADEITGDYELTVRDLLTESANARGALLNYLANQRNQYRFVTVETLDSSLFLISADPLDGSRVLLSPPSTYRVAECGVGVMYRLTDVVNAIATVGPVHEPLLMRLALLDGTGGATTTHLFAMSSTQKARHIPGQDSSTIPAVTLAIGLPALSSLVFGSVTLQDILAAGLAKVTPERHIEFLSSAFRAPRPEGFPRF